MPYQTVDDIPQNVKDRVSDPTRRRQWLHVWNSEYAAHGDESRAFAAANSVVSKAANMSEDSQDFQEFQFFLPITKIDKERRTVSGYATTEARDLDGERISLDAVRKALPGYMQWRNIREMHTNSAVGKAQEANMDDKGLFLTAKIVDDNAWNKVLEGIYQGYSVGGRKLAKVGDTITELELVEISIVDRPCNSECRFEVQKRASPDASAYLVQLRRSRNRKDEALEKMAEVVQTLTREDDDDGFPFEEPIFEKREFSADQRQAAAETGAALPDGSFPIKNESDLSNARQAIGRAKDKKKARAHIKTRARELGVKLPDAWSKKFAKSLILEAEKNSIASPPSPVSNNEKPSASSVVEKGTDPRHELGSGTGDMKTDNELFLSPGGDKENADLAKFASDENRSIFKSISKQVKKMAELDLTKAAPMNVVQAARGNLKKSKAAMREAEDCIKSAHAAVRAAILAKAGKSSDGGEDDMMKTLQKAYAAVQAARTFNKAANGQLKKAAGGPTDGTSDYSVPVGVKEVSSDAGMTAGMFQLDQSPGDNGAVKTAKVEDFVSRSEADALARAAAAEAKVSVLEKLPAGGRRPMPFAMPGNETAGFDPAGMEPEDAFRKAGGMHIGNIIAKGGKSVFDPSFKGGAV